MILLIFLAFRPNIKIIININLNLYLFIYIFKTTKIDKNV